jgi:hypothetical protein
MLLHFDADFLPPIKRSPKSSQLKMRAYNGFSGKQRSRAQGWLNRQWKSGALARPIRCVACGQGKGIIDAHAEDYSEPFAAGKTDQYHLCFTCHMMVHWRFRSPEDWLYYQSVIRCGGRYAPAHKRDIGGFRARHTSGKRPMSDEQGRPPKTFVLDEIGPSPPRHSRRQARCRVRNASS